MSAKKKIDLQFKETDHQNKKTILAFSKDGFVPIAMMLILMATLNNKAR